MSIGSSPSCSASYSLQRSIQLELFTLSAATSIREDDSRFLCQGFSNYGHTVTMKIKLCLDTQCVIVGGLSMELCGVPGDAAIIQEQVTGLALCIHNMEQHPTWFSCRNFLVKKLSGERSSTNVSGNSLLEM